MIFCSIKFNGLMALLSFKGSSQGKIGAKK